MNRKKLDKLARAHVLERDGRRCRFCGKPGNEWAHILTRGTAPALRWDPQNAVTLCHGDHAYFTDHPTQWKTWVAREFGEGYWDMLKRRQAFAEREPIVVEAVVRELEVPPATVADRGRIEGAAW